MKTAFSFIWILSAFFYLKGPKKNSAYFIALLLLSVGLNAICYTASNSLPWIIEPASFLSREFVFGTTPEFRKLFEPVVLILGLSLSLTGNSIAAIGLLIAHLIEVNTLFETGLLASSLKYCTLIVFFFLLQKKYYYKNSFAVFIVSALALSVFLILAKQNLKQELQPFVHYYSWFPENWKALSAQQPSLGKYSTEDPLIFRKQIAQLKQIGVKGILFDWWPVRSRLGKRVIANSKLITNEDNLKFAIHFETLELGVNSSTDKLILTPQNKERLLERLNFVADTFFKDNNYYLIRSRPLVALYSTRHIQGDLCEVLNKFKSTTKEKFGFEPYIASDEVYYNVLSNKTDTMKHRFEAEWDRIKCFDAIFGYNPYEPYDKALVADGSRSLAEGTKLFSYYQKVAATAAIDLIPTAMPGYNDRLLRPTENHPVIERNYGGKSFFEATINQWVTPFKPNSGLYFITSYNEWNEGTQIEPAVEER